MKRQAILAFAFLFFGLSRCAQTADQKDYQLKIAYNVWYDREADDYEVFVMNMDGSGPKNISNWKGVDWVYYAYEDKIYFISDRDTTHRTYFLYETDANGENIRRVADFRLQDSWLSSRNKGQELIVDPHKDVDSVFRIIDLKGQVIARVDPKLAYFNDPFFSPDGKQIVFRGSHQAFKKDSGYLDELYIMDADGNNLRRLTHYPATDTTAKWWNYHAGPPFWEPNKNLISYNSVQNGNSSLFTIKSDGTDLEQLTPDGFGEAWHAWSPDGKYICYDGYDLTEKPNYDIYIMNSDGSGMKRLTTDVKHEQAPVFVKVYKN